MKLAIIGGGASGLFAAAQAAGTGKFSEITVYERLERVGKKLLATGNGRCNILNTDLSRERYHSGAPDTAMRILEAFPPDRILEAFAGMGLLCRAEEGGRVYPYSAQASAVLDVLRFCAAERGVVFAEGAPVDALQRTPAGFRLRTGGVIREADRVIVACGGRAAPRLGSDGSGHALLESLGHSVTPVFPAIVQLRADTAWIRQLKGIRCEMEARFCDGEEVLGARRGEVLFTEYGLSGIAVLQLSRLAAGARRPKVLLDAMPEYGADELAAMLRARAGICRHRALFDFFTGVLNKRYGQMLLKFAGFALSDPAAVLTEPDFVRIAALVKAFEVGVTGTTGFANAQATAGGASLPEFDGVTLESKLVPGLFACGEVLDVDGDCGGFNLTWCWASARAAALGACGQI